MISFLLLQDYEVELRKLLVMGINHFRNKIILGRNEREEEE